MKTKIFGLLLVIAFLMPACKDYFNYQNDTLLKEDFVFSDYNYIKQVLANAYTQLPSTFNRIDNGMLSSATDESEHAWDYSTIQNFNNGSWSSFSNPDDVWTKQYQLIRRAYVFLNGTDTVKFKQFKYVDDVTYNRYVAELKQFRAESRFLIAFSYFELFKRYGGVPIVNRLYDVDENLNLPKSSVTDVVNFIVANCDSAIKVLPKVYDTSNTGRATLGTAMALKCRTLLYAASPLYNNSTYSNALLDQSAVVAKEFIATTGTLKSTYALESNYGALFTRKTNSKELIFERREGNANTYEKANFPIGFDGSGVGATCPSQNLVDAYEMTNGKAISDPTSGYSPADPYKNRDPRLGYTVILNNSVFKARPIECWTGGLDGKGKEKATKTGYYIKKYVDDALNLLNNNTSRHTWYFFRLGEIYLNYAEAMNEAFGPMDARYGLTAVDAVNAIRVRAGMPVLVAADYASATTLRAKIRNERFIELAFEEHRSWDVRRWKIAETTLGADLIGMDIVKKPDNSFTYTPYVVEKRVFLPKMYFYPIPNAEILKEAKLEQNAGW
jgi:starch-binding outer membrane protein, SusD/RagB family